MVMTVLKNLLVEGCRVKGPEEQNDYSVKKELSICILREEAWSVNCV